jgi:UDP-glucose 4-epimerase
VVFAGSSSCYGDLPESPKRETSRLMPLSPYAAAKLAAEMYMEAYARSYRLETVRLRYFNVFGPRQDPKGPYAAVIPLFVAALLEGRRPVIFGDGNQSRDFVFVDNVVNANLLAATVEGVSGNVYNVGSGESLTVNDLLSAICRILDVEFDPEYRPARLGDILHSGADISAARQDLGYQCAHDWKSGLEQTVRWYAEEHRRQRTAAPVATPAATR